MSLHTNATHWLTLKEESFIFDEVLVQTRFNDLSEPEQDTEEKSTPSDEPINDNIGLSTLEHCGLVEVDPFDFSKKAIEQWTKDLLGYCQVTTSSYEGLVKKRFAVQKYLHSV